MGIAVVALLFLVFFLVIMRQTSVYLYVWIPLVANLVTWGCLGGCLSLMAFAEERREIGKGLGMASAGWLAFYIGIIAIYILVLAIATIAVFPPRKVWSKQAVRGPLILAAAIFVCLLIPLLVLLGR